MAMASWRPLVIAVVAAALLACTGTQRPDELATSSRDAASTGGGDRTSGTATDGATGADGATADGAAPSPTAGADGSGTGTTAAGPGGGSAGDSGVPAGGGDDGPPDAGIFAAEHDRIGITGTSIEICAHAALQLGAVFSATADDFMPYWDMVNEAGGIDGRQVHFTFTDDQYTPQGGVQAAQQCKDRDAFLMVGGIGFDTAPAVRQFAEQNDMLYLSSFATESDIGRYQRSFTFVPSIERLGLVAGQYAAAANPGARFAVVWRNSPNWQGGRDQFRAAVEAAGGTVVADVAVEKDQGDYTNAILTLKRSGADVVLGWVNVLEFAQLETQAAIQNYFPQWVVAGFNLVTDTVGHDIAGSRGPAAIGVWVTPPFPADPGADYQAEIDRMRATYQQYRPQSAGSLTDTHWQFWLFSAGLHQLLLDCGPDCTRDRLAGMLLDGYQQPATAVSCPVDFRRGGGRLGGFSVDIYRAVTDGDGARWSSDVRCAEGF